MRRPNRTDMRAGSLYALSAVVVLVIVVLAVLLFRLEGTPTGTTRAESHAACNGMRGEELERCVEAQARETGSSTSSGRARRGTGIEGVTSGGTTIDPPGRGD